MKRQKKRDVFGELFNLTQQDLADFLKVDRSTFAHSRTGYRLMKTSSAKLDRFHQLYQVQSAKKMPLPEQLQGKLKEKASDHVSDLTLRQMICGRKAMQLEKKLVKMQNDYSNTIIWLQMLEHLLEEEHNTKEAASDKAFYNLWQSKAKERLPVCCPTEQMKFKIKIHLLKTEEELIAKILKGEYYV